LSESSAPEEWIRVGERLRQAREDAHLSVRELARRVDVSPGHISNVERGLASLSVRSLYALVTELGISMDSLFVSSESPAGDRDATVADLDDLHVNQTQVDDPEVVDPPLAATPHSRTDSIGPLEQKGIVLRQAKRPAIPLPTGTRWERLTPEPERGAEFIEVIYPPNESGTVPHEFIRHPSREYGIIVEGELTIQVGFDVAVLTTGDSIAFNSTTPHRYWNATGSTVRAIWFIWDSPAFLSEGDAPDGRSLPQGNEPRGSDF
jgi:transcriptional regulator with XRE-family HTH domain